MAHLLLLTNALAPSAEVLPALGLLAHQVRILPAEPTALVDAPPADIVLVDARRELAVAKSLCRVLRATGMSVRKPSGISKSLSSASMRLTWPSVPAVFFQR